MFGGSTRTRIVIAAIAISAAAMGILSKTHAATPVTLDDIKKVVPQASSYSHELKPLDYYKVVDVSGKITGVAFVTSSIPPAVRGHNAEIDMLVGMDIKGVVTGIGVLSHREDSEYFGKILSSDFFKKFAGRSVEKGFSDIEAVTGATVSSEAIRHDVETAAFEITKKLIDTGALSKNGGAPRPFDFISSAAVLLLAIGAFVAVRLHHRRWTRYALWILSVAVVGIWLNTPITIGTFVDIRNLTLPSFVPLTILFIFAIAACFAKCNLYCAYTCPFGALQEGASRIGVPKCSPDDRVEKNASWLRWIVLLATVFAIASGVNAFRTIEPFSLCFSRTLNVIVLAQAGAVLIAALFIRRPWCRYFCPTGALLDLFAQLGVKVRQISKCKLQITNKNEGKL